MNQKVERQEQQQKEDEICLEYLTKEIQQQTKKIVVISEKHKAFETQITALNKEVEDLKKS